VVGHTRPSRTFASSYRRSDKGVIARAPLKEAGRGARPSWLVPTEDKQKEEKSQRHSPLRPLSRCNACAGIVIPRQSFARFRQLTGWAATCNSIGDLDLAGHGLAEEK
jgi:hypothetical protein